MGLEQLIFVVIAFAFFIYMFYKMMRINDISYIIVLVLETVAIILNFLEVLFEIKLNIVLIILKYLLGIILPTLVIIIETKGKSIAEIYNLYMVKNLLKLENTKKAKKILLVLTSKYPENYEAHRLLAEVYEKEGGMRKAIDEYVQAVDLNKKDYDSYYKVAYLLTHLDRRDDASEMLFNLLKVKPDYYEATTLLGDILIEEEKYKEAVNVYQEALKYNPMSFDINYNLGIVYTMLNDFKSAKKCYEMAAQINALSYGAKYALAEIELIYKNPEEAEKHFLEVIESDELSADAYYELAKIYLIKGEMDTAIKYANVAIDVNAKRIVKKIKLDPMFIPIFAKLSIPFNLEHKDENKEAINKENMENKKLEKKEIKAKEHLEEMIDITRNLTNEDIQALKNQIHLSNVRKTKEKEEREKH